MLIKKIIQNDRFCIFGEFNDSRNKKVVFDIYNPGRYNFEIVFRHLTPLDIPILLSQSRMLGSSKLFFYAGDVFLGVSDYFLNLRTGRLIQDTPCKYEQCPQAFYIEV